MEPENEVISRLDELNQKFDLLIIAIQDINKTLKANKKKSTSSSNCIGFILHLLQLFIHFIATLLSIFNLKFILTTLCLCLYIFQDEVNDYFDTNISSLMHSMANHIIFPQLSFDAYFKNSKPHILALQTTKLQFEDKIIVKWTEYEEQYNKYNELLEHEINYNAENTDLNIRQLVLIGPTGVGKSLFANRLSGYQGEGGENGYFQTSETIQSCTTMLGKLIVYNLHSINISILDTPGIFDSETKDIVYQHNLIKYLQGSNGVNAFLLVLKKERLSKFIQQMLRDFHQTFGDEFWSHLIFVVNFWNERERKNWEKWNESLINRIRKDFDLGDSEKYPLHVVGLNNFGSYKLEIQRDLIPNIPSTRLESQLFVSPMDTLKVEMHRVHEEINALMHSMAEKQQKINLHCTELKYIHSWIGWLSPKTIVENEKKIRKIQNVIDAKCNYDVMQHVEISNIENKMKFFVIEDEENDLKRLESANINYEDDDLLFRKYAYYIDETGQKVINCFKEKNALNDLNYLFGEKEYPMQLITKEIICSSLVDSCCDFSILTSR